MEDKIWFSAKHSIWILRSRDRGLLFQPGVLYAEPSNFDWEEVPGGLATIALESYPGRDKGQ